MQIIYFGMGSSGGGDGGFLAYITQSVLKFVFVPSIPRQLALIPACYTVDMRPPPAAAVSQLPLPGHTTIYVWAAALSSGQQQENMFFLRGSENWADSVYTVRLRVII